MTTIFDQMLSRYEIHTNDDYSNALHEVMQLIALAGLYRGGFLKMQHFTVVHASVFSMMYNGFRKIWIFRF